jgi:Uma2 family endonuclease
MTLAADLPARPLTLDDVTHLAESDSTHRFELTEGNLVVMPPGTWRHQEICGLLFAWFVANGYRGRVNIAPGVRTAADDLNGRIPDLVVTNGSVPDDVVWLLPEMVALAVEIVSKGSERGGRYVESGRVALDDLLAGEAPDLS